MTAAAVTGIIAGDFATRSLTLLRDARGQLLAAARDAVELHQVEDPDPVAQADADEELADRLLELARTLRRRARAARATAARRATRRQQAAGPAPPPAATPAPPEPERKKDPSADAGSPTPATPRSTCELPRPQPRPYTTPPVPPAPAASAPGAGRRPSRWRGGAAVAILLLAALLALPVIRKTMRRAARWLWRGGIMPQRAAGPSRQGWTIM